MRFLLAMLLTGCVPHLTTTETVEDTGPWNWDVPENTWPVSTPPDGTEGEGFSKGDVVPDLRLTDQNGDEVSLWQFYGNVVLLDISTMWCAPCRELAKDTEHTYQDYKEDGFVYLTILQETSGGGPPAKSDLNDWADAYEITAPVLADGEKLAEEAVSQGQYPALLLVDRKLKVIGPVSPPEDAVVRDAIADAL